MFNFDLSQPVETFILEHSPCREYDIIKYLQGLGVLSRTCLAQPLSLFRCHFLIFNALYRLQLSSLTHKRYQLLISALEIKIEPINPKLTTQSSEKKPSEFDSLALFYLNLDNLNKTTETDIEKLLNHFWQYYFNDQQKQDALDVLGLSSPVDFNIIKKQYRRLAMKHHPDRGGDANKLIEIHQAMQCLQQYYP